MPRGRHDEAIERIALAQRKIGGVGSDGGFDGQ